jgi:hypothetical protein
VATRDALVPGVWRCVCFPVGAVSLIGRSSTTKQAIASVETQLLHPSASFYMGFGLLIQIACWSSRGRPARSRARNGGRCPAESNCFRLSVRKKAPCCITAPSSLGEVESQTLPMRRDKNSGIAKSLLLQLLFSSPEDAVFHSKCLEHSDLCYN